MPAHFESLRDQLLRGGVAPRHVTRYLNELTEHLEDLINEEEHAGCDHEDAEQSALIRLGDTDRLAMTMLARKEFLSWSHRAPWAVFFLGPFVVLVGINFVSLELMTAVIELYGSGLTVVPMLVLGWFHPLYTSITEFDLFVLPLLLGGAISYLAVRQRMTPVWPVVGFVVVAIFCGLQSFMIQWSPLPNGLDSFGASWAFLPHAPITIQMVFRVLWNLGLTTALFALWRSRRPHHG